MIACRRLAGMFALALILALTCLTDAFANPVTWTLSGMTFDDGGTATGYFIYDADTDTLSDSSISVAGGNTGAFPPTTYQGPGSPLGGDSSNGFYFWAPGQVGDRYMNIKHTGLTDAGGTVALALGNQSWECTNCTIIRYVTGGNVIGTSTPTITSADAATFSVGTAGSFTVTTTAATSVTEAGSLPSGVSFTNNGDGTATLTGTPAAGSSGTYPLTLTASNGVPPDATQSFTLTVGAAPAITSGNAVTFSVGSAGNYTVTTDAFPTAALTETGSLPSGVTFADNGDGTATLAGTPAAGSSGAFALTLTASNGISPDATQNFTLNVDGAPAITSGNSVTLTVGIAGVFTVTTNGFPAAALTKTGTLPSGVTFADNGNGTATLAGTPAAGSGGTYPLTFTASNGVSPDATQAFTLTVIGAPAITSGNTATFTTGNAGTFNVTTSGFPTAALSESGALPTGVTFIDNGNGTGTLSGVTNAVGNFVLTITANNGVAPAATQTFTLRLVSSAPLVSAPMLDTSGAIAMLLLLLAGAFLGLRRRTLVH